MSQGGPAPRWVWPALALAMAAGAAVMHLAAAPGAPSPALAALPAVLPTAQPAAATSPPPSEAAAAPVPAATAVPPAPVFRAVVLLDGVPKLALVHEARPLLVRVGELLPGGAAVLAIEPRALVLRDAGIERRLALEGPVVALASPVAAASAPAMPPPGYGAFVMPPHGDERVGSGNAAFRAAVEDKARTVRK